MVVKWNGQRIESHMRQAALRGVVIAAHEVRSEAIRLILETKKSGRIYTRRGVQHQASAPGEPPASDTGTLVNSIDVVPNPATLSAVINASAQYARALEYGTQTIEPRPFMRPALNKKRVRIQTILSKELRRFFK